MKKLSYLIFCIYCVLISAACIAQNGETDEKPQMADGLRASGKIYVVVAVVVTILLGLIFYLVQLDKKVRKLERDSGVDKVD